LQTFINVVSQLLAQHLTMTVENWDDNSTYYCYQKSYWQLWIKSNHSLVDRVIDSSKVWFLLWLISIVVHWRHRVQLPGKMFPMLSEELNVTVGHVQAVRQRSAWP